MAVLFLTHPYLSPGPAYEWQLIEAHGPHLSVLLHSSDRFQGSGALFFVPNRGEMTLPLTANQLTLVKGRTLILIAFNLLQSISVQPQGVQFGLDHFDELKKLGPRICRVPSSMILTIKFLVTGSKVFQMAKTTLGNNLDSFSASGTV